MAAVGTISSSGSLRVLGFATLFLCVVLPNSLKLLSAVILACAALWAMRYLRQLAPVKKVFVCYCASAGVTLVYLCVGLLRGAPWEACWQIFYVYVASPGMWLVLCASLMTVLQPEALVRWFVIFGFCAAISVALYFILYSIGGSAAVAFFKQSGNLYVNEGQSNATMYVFGSLVFLCGGFFSAPELIKSKISRLALLSMLGACAVVSGRSALLLSVVIGLSLGVLLRSRVVASSKMAALKKSLGNFILISLVSLALLMLLGKVAGLDLRAIFAALFDKIIQGGGEERNAQARALLEGVLVTKGLGAGHGIGVDLIRSVNFPWRYEHVWIATLYRVGVIGAIIYLWVFIIYFKDCLKENSSGGMSSIGKFFFSGFVCAFAAGATNPYIETFVFQWMFILPISYHFMRARMHANTRLNGLVADGGLVRNL